MENNLTHNSIANPYFIIVGIVAIAAGLGIYGLYVIFALIRSPNYESRSFQVDRFIMGVFNIFLSLFAIYATVLFM